MSERTRPPVIRRRCTLSALALAGLVCFTAPELRAEERVGGGASISAGVQVPTAPAVSDSTLHAKRATTFGAEVGVAAPLGRRTSFVLGGGVAVWTWSDVRAQQAVDGTVFLLSLAPGVRTRLGSGGPYVGGGVEVGRTLPVAISRTVFSGDTGGGATEHRSFSVLGPRVDVGSRVGPDDLFDLGLRAAWLYGAPGDPVFLSVYVGAWF